SHILCEQHRPFWGFPGFSGAQCLLRNYWLTAPPAVSVPLGLCVIIPCNFTYEQRHADRDAPLYGYWFEAESVYTGAPVATNNPRKTVQSYTRNRFTLSEHLDQGDCSLTIKNARKTDRKQYIFRVEREPRAKFTYSFYAVPYVNVTGERLWGCLLSAQRGDSVVLRCEVEGNPVPSVTWVRGPQPPQTLQLVSSENELKLSSLTQQHEGKYECRAQNSEGSSKATFLLSTTGNCCLPPPGISPHSPSLGNLVNSDPTGIAARPSGATVTAQQVIGC
uniref:Ig-like domain-containing protein n=1 Tax=Varanus komodoensis TaxID=61221 RepID=A0A8D2J7B7_VARKO